MTYYFSGLTWENANKIISKEFTCWNCGNKIASNTGYLAHRNRNEVSNARIYICHKCNSPNVFDKTDNPLISSKIGKYIKKLPDEISKTYEEARNCLSVDANTAAIMLFRKILMNIAVNDGADENKNFKYYVNYLCENGCVHKKQVKQADKIRELGNDANHKIETRTKAEAMEMLKFIEFLLLNNYEFADEDEGCRE